MARFTRSPFGAVLGFLLITLLFISQTLYGQQTKISGKVTDANDGTPLIGVTVVVKGTSQGITTDADGEYTITVSPNTVLEFSMIGYNIRDTSASDLSIPLNIKLVRNKANLNEVVVVSYGTQNKRDITGAISQISATKMKDIPAAEFGQKLQGKVAGIQINQTSGLPGEGISFRIRGAASLQGGNQPLVVVDGQPITGSINFLDPNDIESISVLKDASATALYGSRAANGVVIITTKQAKMGQTNVSLDVYYGSQTVPKKGRPDMMNAREFATFMKGYYEDKIKYENWVNPTTGKAEVPDDYANPDQYGTGTDWYDALLRHAPIQNYSLTITTGTEKISSSSSLNYFNQQGVLSNTGMQRFSFRSNNEYRFNDKIKVGLNVSPTYQLDNNTLGLTGGNRQILVGAELSSPLVPRLNPDGSVPILASSYGMFKFPNYYTQLTKNTYDKRKTFRLLANAYLDIEIFAGLHLKTTVNTDMGSEERNIFYPSTSGSFNTPPPRRTAATQISDSYTSWLNENMLTYNIDFGQHHLEALVGYSEQQYQDDSHRIDGTDFPNDKIPWIIAAATTSGNTNTTDWTLLSMYGRINYNFKERYYLEGNIRRDGSSRFGENKKWAVFPSISAGWIVSDEPFLKNNSTVSFLKIRVSYGLTGNNNIGNYPSISLLGATNYTFNNTLTQGLSITSLGNNELTWETTKQLDIGLDMSLFDDRISFGYDFYRKITDGLLYQIDLPAGSGFTSIQYNIGAFRIWGHEFQVNSRNLTGNLKWNTAFNISFNNNKVLKLGTDDVPIGGVSRYYGYTRTAVDHHIGELWGYIFDGVYMTQDEFDKDPKEETSAVGTARMKDVNGDGKITSDDRTFLGNPNPKFTYGMTNSFSYKDFDFTIVIAGSKGNKIMNINQANTNNLDGVFNVDKSILGRWRSPEDPGNGKVPRTLSNTTELYRLANSNWVYDGSFLTVKNITLGYTISADHLKYIKSIRVYGGVQQAFVFTKYDGNPEVDAYGLNNMTMAGLDDGRYPVPRTFLFGADFNF